MPRKKNVSVEIVRKPSPAGMKAVLRQMIRDELENLRDERKADQLAPSHQARETSIDLRCHQTMFDRRKWGLYFAKWGCARCGRKKNVTHASNGMCTTCVNLLTQRLIQIKREYDRANPESQIAKDIDHLTRRVRSAEELLGEHKG